MKVLWSKAIGTSDSDEDEADGIVVDDVGNVTVGGVYRGSLFPYGLNSVGQGDIWLASHNSMGAVRWAWRMGSSGEDNAFALATDGVNTYMSGWFAGTVDFRSGYVLRASGGHDMFVAKFDTNGNTIWARAFGGLSEDGGNEIAVTRDGQIAVAGMSGGDFQGSPFVGPGTDGYVMRLDVDGNPLHMTKFSGLGSGCRIRAIAINEEGEVAVGFMFKGTMKWSGGQLTSSGSTDGAVAKINTDGSVAWVRPETTRYADFVSGVAITPDGSVFAGGIKDGDDFLGLFSPTGSNLWHNNYSYGNKGFEITLSPDAIYTSGGRVSFVGSRATSYLIKNSLMGAPLWSYSPITSGFGAGAYGDGISVNGEYGAQVIRFIKKINVNGTEYTSQGKDSLIIFYSVD